MADRVAAVVRHRGEVLGCHAGAGLVLPARPDDAGAPEGSLRSLLEGLGLGDADIERRGEDVRVAGDAVVPFLVSAADRAVAGAEGCPDPTWAPPSALSAPASRLYAAVAPTVATVAGDRERGSAAVSIDALWALRDAAAAADALEAVRETAEALLAARPSMAALGNRVNRAVAGADAPADVVAGATEGIRRAHGADGAAAAVAAEGLDGRVLTLSRSGTVGEALLAAGVAVDLLASRPGGEGLAVAAELVEAGLAVSTYPDAAVYDRLRSGEVDAVLVGADAVGADGALVNKVGTWAAAHAAAVGGVPCFAVCAADKVRPAGSSPAIEPRFDRTPPGFLTALFTDRGRLGAEDVAEIAEAHRDLAAWRDG